MKIIQERCYSKTHSLPTPLQQPTNCLSVFDHLLGFALKGLMLEGKFSNDPIGENGVIISPYSDSEVKTWKQCVEFVSELQRHATY